MDKTKHGWVGQDHMNAQNREKPKEAKGKECYNEEGGQSTSSSPSNPLSSISFPHLLFLLLTCLFSLSSLSEENPLQEEEVIVDFPERQTYSFFV